MQKKKIIRFDGYSLNVCRLTNGFLVLQVFSTLSLLEVYLMILVGNHACTFHYLVQPLVHFSPSSTTFGSENYQRNSSSLLEIFGILFWVAIQCTIWELMDMGLPFQKKPKEQVYWQDMTQWNYWD